MRTTRATLQPTDRPLWRWIAGLALGLATLGCGDGDSDAGRREHAGHSEAAGSGEQHPAIGINLAEVTYYASEFPFVDAFRSSSPFLHQTAAKWELDEPLELRPDGYPARLAPGHFAGTLMFRENGGHYPAGDYVCLHDGDGDIHFDYAASILRGVPGRLVVRVRPSDDGIYLKITRTNEDDPVRNIRLLMPGHEESHVAQPFTPAFLNRWRDFAALRFMDWGRTNDSRVVRWSDRTTLNDQTQAGASGVAPELMVRLANELDADPWFCIPHRADDDYVRQLAALCAAQLEPGRRPHVEYSNETWNGMFDQAEHCRERGLAAELSADPHTARLRFYAQRSVEIFAIWEQVFGSPDSLVRVLAMQNADPAAATTVLEWHDAWRHADALAVAPYFGGSLGSPDRRRETEQLSVAAILDRCEGDLRTTMLDTAAHARSARGHGLRLLAYEAGQHLAGHGGAENSEPLTALFVAANRSPRMGELYELYLQRWQQLGGGTLMAFCSTQTPSKWGCWGVCEDYGPDSEGAVKYAALRRFMARTSGAK